MIVLFWGKIGMCRCYWGSQVPEYMPGGALPVRNRRTHRAAAGVHDQWRISVSFPPPHQLRRQELHDYVVANVTDRLGLTSRRRRAVSHHPVRFVLRLLRPHAGALGLHRPTGLASTLDTRIGSCRVASRAACHHFLRNFHGRHHTVRRHFSYRQRDGLAGSLAPSFNVKYRCSCGLAFTHVYMACSCCCKVEMLAANRRCTLWLYFARNACIYWASRIVPSPPKLPSKLSGL